MKCNPANKNFYAGSKDHINNIATRQYLIELKNVFAEIF